MEPKRDLGSSGPPPASPHPPIDRETVRQAKTVMTNFAHTVTAIKLYPTRHEKAAKFGEEFLSSLTRFLEDRGLLEIGIEENAFTLGGEIIFQEERGLKSLPYLFFKDGMRGLTFLPGLTRKEFEDFLEIVKVSAELPSEESDIVDALWEIDLGHIRYDAPEEFLMAKIAPDLRPDEMLVERKFHDAGRIDLDPADTAAYNARILEIVQTETKEPIAWAELYGTLDQGDLNLLETMLTTDRKTSADREFIETLDEVLFLEERMESFTEILEFLASYFRQLVERAELADALRLMDTLTDLRGAFAEASPDRAAAAERTLKKIMDATDPKGLRDIARPEQIAEPRWFFDFLQRFGLRFLRTGIETFEAVEEPAWRTAGVDYLRRMIREYPDETAALAQNEKPVLTKTLISLLTERADKKAILLLISIARGGNPEIRTEAVQQIGRLTDDLARKAVLEFLHDSDERVRIAAANSARLEIDQRTLEQVLKEASGKDFLARSPDEQAVFFLALGRTDTVEAAAALRSILRRRSLFGRARVQEARVLAVAGLAVMTCPEALETLRSGARSPKRAVAKACAEALKRFHRLRGGAQ